MMDPCLKRKIFWMAMTYIRRKNASYQDIADKYGISKSRVTRYFNLYLPTLYPRLHKHVKAKAQKNVSQNQTEFIKKRNGK